MIISIRIVSCVTWSSLTVSRSTWPSWPASSSSTTPCSRRDCRNRSEGWTTWNFNVLKSTCLNFLKCYCKTILRGLNIELSRTSLLLLRLGTRIIPEQDLDPGSTNLVWNLQDHLAGAAGNRILGLRLRRNSLEPLQVIIARNLRGVDQPVTFFDSFLKGLLRSC